MDVQGDVSWTRRLERLIADEGEKALCMNWMHIQAEALYSKRSTAISIPVIVLSTLAGTASIGSSSLFGDSPFSSVGIGAVSIVVGILNTLGSYFAWAKRAEGHRISAQMFAKLNKFITIELALPRAERMPPGDFLKLVKQEGDRLAETAPAIPPKIVDSFRYRFRKSTLSKPNVANGLDPIEIFDESSMEGETPLRIREAADTDTDSTLSANAPPKRIGMGRNVTSIFPEDSLAELKKTMEPTQFKVDPALLESIKKLAETPQVKQAIGALEKKAEEAIPEEVRLVIRDVVEEATGKEKESAE